MTTLWWYSIQQYNLQCDMLCFYATVLVVLPLTQIDPQLHQTDHYWWRENQLWQKHSLSHSFLIDTAVLLLHYFDCILDTRECEFATGSAFPKSVWSCKCHSRLPAIVTPSRTQRAKQLNITRCCCANHLRPPAAQLCRD